MDNRVYILVLHWGLPLLLNFVIYYRNVASVHGGVAALENRKLESRRLNRTLFLLQTFCSPRQRSGSDGCLTYGAFPILKRDVVRPSLSLSLSLACSSGSSLVSGAVSSRAYPNWKKFWASHTFDIRKGKVNLAASISSWALFGLIMLFSTDLNQALFFWLPLFLSLIHI